ncbi:MAG TPA: glycosyltransferase family 39 protein [Pyrinomonadaceae bacterium]|nr:glycosyltransferase family 39 protein [Pyrinomonadaceae bacterium]
MAKTLDNQHASAKTSGFSAGIILFAIAFLIFLAARLWHLSATCLWFDEVFSVHAARHSWAEMFKFVAADIIHPPLFYAVLKIWIVIGGESLVWLRLLSVLFAVAGIAPFYLLCRELNLKPNERNLAFTVIAVSGFLIKYTQEVRMYSLLLLLSVTSIWLFVRLLRNSRPRALAALTVCNLLLVYTHYYGWLLVFAQACVVLISYRRSFSRFLLSAAVLIFTYIPWIYAVATFREPAKGLAQNIGWIKRPNAGDLVEYFVLLNKPFLFSQSTLDRADSFLIGWLALLLVGVALAILVFRRWRDRAFTEVERVLLALTFLPVILAAGLSWLLPYSIWGSRHLIISAVPFFILAGIAVANLKPNFTKFTVLIGLASVTVLAGVVYSMKPVPNLSWCEWNNLAKQIPASTLGEPAPVVYTFEDLVAYHVWFAPTRTLIPPFNVKVVKGLPGVPDDPAFFLPRRFSEVEIVPASEIAGQHIWVAYRARRWDDNQPPMRHMKTLGYQTRNVLSSVAQGEQVFLVELSRER